MLCNKIKKVDLPLFLAVAGKDFIAEEKYDGVRVRLEVKGGKLALHSRGKSGDVIYKYPEINDNDVNTDIDMLLDGEMCVFNEQGTSDFNGGIAFRMSIKSPDKAIEAAKTKPAVYVVFDVVEFQGKDLRDTPWTQRREILESLDILKSKVINLSPVFTDIPALWDEVISRGGEGIIIKKCSALYAEDKRSSAWRKVKNILETDIKFTSFTRNPAGIRISNSDDIAIQVSGYNAPSVQQELERNGEVLVTVNHLGMATSSGKLRQPTYKKIVQ